MDIDSILAGIQRELKYAETKHPDFAKDLVHKAAVLAEEAGEAVRATLLHEYEGGDIEEVKIELLQTAAVCIRILKEL